MNFFLLFFLLVTTGFQGLMMITGTIGLFRLKNKPRPPLSSWPSISVIIPARNEASHIGKTLDSLLQQDYSGKWTILVIDDRSEDKTASIVTHYTQHHERISLLQIKDENPISPKKNALRKGILTATGDIIVTTDADCLYDKTWLTTLLSAMTDDVGLVAGPVFFYSERRPIPFWQRLQWLDYFMQTILAAGLIGVGRPCGGSACNIAFRKKIYMDLAYHHQMDTFVSGDDVLFIQAVATKTSWKVAYVINPSSIVQSASVESLSALWHQRLRWASKGRAYTWGLQLYLFGFYLYDFVLLAAPIYSIFCNESLYPIFLCWGLKLFFEFIPCVAGSYLLKEWSLLPYFIPCVLMQTLFAPILGFGALFLPFKWKNACYYQGQNKTGRTREST